MGSDMETAELLAKEVHRDVDLKDVAYNKEIPEDFQLDIDNLGIWIDPIDSTADYINGGEVVDEDTGIHLSGLRCVTVLIGAYVKSTGIPTLGVVNQPFYSQTESGWVGNCYWGLMQNGIGTCSIEREVPEKQVVVLSKVENEEIKSKLAAAGFTLVEPAGAGYKILNVALGQASAYVLSKGSTYKWDTCGPQALLRSLDGDVIEFQKFIENNDEDMTVKYLPTGNGFSNSTGLIAYKDKNVFQSLKSVLC